MLHAGNALADFGALHVLHITQHAGVAEILLRQIVGGQGSGVIGRQRDQVVEDAGLGGGIALEGADALVGFLRQFAAIIIDAHQPGAIIGAHVLVGRNIGIIDLLAEIQRPVEAGAVVVDQLGSGDHLADAVHHSGDLADVRLFGFDPQQVSTVLQAVDAVEHAAIFA